MVFRTALFLVALLLLLSTTNAATYYVSDTGSPAPTADCEISSPCATVSQAFSKMSGPSDQVIISGAVTLGGATSVPAGTVSIIGSNLAEDSIDLEGASVVVTNSPVFIMQDLTVHNGYSGSASGGCVNTASPAASFIRVAFQNCTSDIQGGAIVATGPVVVDNCSFASCNANIGGAIHTSGLAALDVSDSIFRDCRAENTAGAVYHGSNNAGPLTLKNSQFIDNKVGNNAILYILGHANCGINDLYFDGNEQENDVSNPGIIRVSTTGAATIGGVQVVNSQFYEVVMHIESNNVLAASDISCWVFDNNVARKPGGVVAAVMFNSVTGVLSSGPHTAHIEAPRAEAVVTTHALVDGGGAPAYGQCGRDGIVTAFSIIPMSSNIFTCYCPATNLTVTGNCDCTAPEVYSSSTSFACPRDLPTCTAPGSSSGGGDSNDLSTDDTDDRDDSSSGGDGSSQVSNSLPLIGAIGGCVVLSAMLAVTRIRSDPSKALLAEGESVRRGARPLSNRTNVSTASDASKYSANTTASSVMPRVRRNPDGSFVK